MCFIISEASSRALHLLILSKQVGFVHSYIEATRNDYERIDTGCNAFLPLYGPDWSVEK
jgi:hypothetical protein